MKILYLICHSPLYGANKALLNIFDGLPSDVEPFVVMKNHGGICEELDLRSIPYEIIPHRLSVYPLIRNFKDIILFFPRLVFTLLQNFFANKDLKELVRNIKPDIIHTNVGPDHIGFNVARYFNIPHLWHIREYQDLQFGLTPIPSNVSFKRKIKKSKLIAITRGIYNHYEMNTNAKIIYDGVLSASDTRLNDSKKKYFLFVGRLEKAKGIMELINAFIKVVSNHLEFELLICGDGEIDYVRELKDVANKSKYSDKIKFLGFRNDINNLMYNAYALVVPSHYEGFGFITVEAMYNGCLVIGRNTAGTKEILEKENLGILYNNQSELIEAMTNVINLGIMKFNPMLEKAQVIAINLYSKEINAKLIYEYYKEILN
jgi:glycosyltransferase involved in cell wall biosynthesis